MFGLSNCVPNYVVAPAQSDLTPAYNGAAEMGVWVHQLPVHLCLSSSME